MIVIRDLKTFCFNIDQHKDDDKKLKCKIEFIIESNESLSENKIKNETERLPLKYKHRNNIDKHRKQENE